MKISFITTVFNEEKNIDNFLKSIFSQTKLPDEIIIVDGGSNDTTVSSIKYKKSNIKDRKLKRIKFRVLVKEGNRSVGRNKAIKKAAGDIIVCSDSGNILDKKWLENITKPFKDKRIDVVAGYYRGLAKNIFQKCLVPYVLVMPDKVDPDNFLPATRSIAFTKAVWKKVGGFDERFSHNEDYIFAKKLKEIGAKIVFAKDAIANWMPRNTFKEAFVMFFRFAFGDGESGILRTSVLLLFARYFLASYWIFLIFLYKSIIAAGILLAFFLFYLAWAIKKNYRYVKNKKAFILLPLLQFTADAAVILGTTFGLLKRARQLNYLSYIKQNKFLFLIIAIYTGILLLTLKWGTPNQDHPFPYHMDEWHQLMAIKAIIKHGTTTIPGAAQIPFLYPILSGIYLIPFILLHIVNPFLLKSPVNDLLMQQKLFEVLRSVNILFGIGSILLISKIAKSYLKINPLLPICLFTISPILLILSGHFKYDISLLFWVILSLTLLLNFGEKPTLKNYIYASIACALALATKFSAISLFPLLIFSFFWYILPGKRNYKFLYIGTFIYALTFILIGSPNILFGLADYRELLYSNLISGPQGTDNLILPHPWWIYLVINVLPALFGHPLYILGLVSFLYMLFSLFIRKVWKKNLNRHDTFFLVSFILFIISLVPLKMGATGNRALILLPFLALISGVVVEKVFKNIKASYKFLLTIILILIVFFQLFESTVWMYTKLHTDPQSQSSLWIEKNVVGGTIIGIENIVIYQSLPNIIVREFYSNQYNKKLKSVYTYKIVDSKTKSLPRVVVITNGEIETKMLKKSVKRNLINRLQKEGYKKIASFSPDLTYYKLFLNDIDYYNTSIIALPLTISVYQKLERAKQ